MLEILWLNLLSPLGWALSQIILLRLTKTRLSLHQISSVDNQPYTFLGFAMVMGNSEKKFQPMLRGRYLKNLKMNWEILYQTFTNLWRTLLSSVMKSSQSMYLILLSVEQLAQLCSSMVPRYTVLTLEILAALWLVKMGKLSSSREITSHVIRMRRRELCKEVVA
jgi:hypothetical protein